MKTKLSLNTILIGAILIIVLVNVVILTVFFLSRRSAGTSGNASADEIFATPVRTFSGTVEDKSGNSLTVGYQVLPDVAAEPSRTERFTVAVTEDTAVRKSSGVIPYVFKANGSNPSGDVLSSLDEISIGDRVTVTSTADLQKLKGKKITASLILVAPSTVLSGKVTAVSGQTLTITGVEPLTSVTDTYTVGVTSDTEIVRMPLPPRTTIDRAQASDIRSGTNVTVYFSRNGASDDLTALLVQIVPDPSNIPLPATATGSARPPGAPASSGAVSTSSAVRATPTPEPTTGE